MSDNRIAIRQAETTVELVRQMDRAVAKNRPADVILSQFLRQHREFGGRDRRFFSETVFSYFRWKGWTASFDFLGWEALCAVSYLLDARKMHSAIGVLADRAGLTDRTLAPLHGRSMIEKGVALKEWSEGKLPAHLPQPAASVDVLVPGWVKGALRTDPLVDRDEHFLRCIESFQERPPTWLSVKAGYGESVTHFLAARGITATRHPRIARAAAVPGSPDLGPLRAKLGAFFQVQDLASQCVGVVCEPQPSQRWWDACAGAGGKTLLLLDLMQNQGHVLATDKRPGILGQLQSRARQAGVKSFATGVMDATKTSPADPFFDGVLLDAPCTGIGTWSRNPDARWRTQPEEDKEKARLQGQLLRQVAEKVRPGGVLVYSVCTLTAAESISVIDEFLERRPDFCLDPFLHPLNGSQCDGRVWIWPWDGPCDGMFIARIVRK